MKPPRRTARLVAVVLSVVAVVFTLGFGYAIRRAVADVESSSYPTWLFAAMSSLLVALVLRLSAAVCELFWLERTWDNLPEELRVVGPIQRVSSGLVVGLTVVPGIAWVWKLGLVTGIIDGFEAIRKTVPYEATIPKNLGIAAVVVGWIPILNVYVAPFLWEVFARRIDLAATEILARR